MPTLFAAAPTKADVVLGALGLALPEHLGQIVLVMVVPFVVTTTVEFLLLPVLRGTVVMAVVVMTMVELAVVWPYASEAAPRKARMDEIFILEMLFWTEEQMCVWV